MIRAPGHRGERGFTLIELLVGVAIASIVAAGALALLTAQQRAFQRTSGDRALQETARSALSEIATNVRRAGFGIEPWLAFDFGPITNAPPSWAGALSLTTSGYPPGPPGGSVPACTAITAVTPRDRTNGPDEIVFHTRDPGFMRALTGTASSSTLTLATGLQSALYPGQILQVMCGAASAWAYVTVGAFAAKGATTVSLSSACTGTFPFQQDLLTTGCFAAGLLNVRVYKVNRYHYYVQWYTEDGVQRPYLMLDRGLWNGSTPLVEPVAPDVEDVQFAYVFPNSATAPVALPQLVGATAGTALADAPGSIDLAAAVPPTYTDPLTDPRRRTHSPGNLGAVRISLTVRSTSPDARAGVTDPVPAAGNRAAATGAIYYRRLLVETTEAVRNLAARAPFYDLSGG